MKLPLFKCAPSLLGSLAFTTQLVCATASAAAATTELKQSGSAKERELIRVLKSKAPPEEKAISCKRLAVYGTQEAMEQFDKAPNTLESRPPRCTANKHGAND